MGERGQEFGSGDRSGGLICLVNDTSAAADRKRYVFVLLLERQYLVGRYAIVMEITYIAPTYLLSSKRSRPICTCHSITLLDSANIPSRARGLLLTIV